MVNFLALVFLILLLASIAYYCFCIYAINVFFKQEKQEKDDRNEFSPAISMIKPLCGLEENLRGNLTSFIKQNYPQFQLIFCVREPEDPVIDLVYQLIKEYPEHDLKLVVNDRIIGYNYKVSNLANALEYCKYDFILIADSDIEVETDYLINIVQPLQREEVGVVTCLYQSTGHHWISILESLNAVCNFIPSVFTAQQLQGIDFAFGSTVLIKKSVLTQIGEFKAIANSLADDFLLGNLATQNGYQVVLANHIVKHHIGKESLTDYLLRQIRWYRCIKVQRFAGYWGMLLTQGTILSLIFVILDRASTFSLILLLITFCLRLLMAYHIGVNKLKNPTIFEYLGLIFVVDVLAFYIWLVGLFGNKVTWRSHQFILDNQGKLNQIEKRY